MSIRCRGSQSLLRPTCVSQRVGRQLHIASTSRAIYMFIWILYLIYSATNRYLRQDLSGTEYWMDATPCMEPVRDILVNEAPGSEQISCCTDKLIVTALISIARLAKEYVSARLAADIRRQLRYRTSLVSSISTVFTALSHSVDIGTPTALA
jgi:hypothetical protein